MNILQEQDKHTEELRKCKMIFLRNQNDWMSKEKDLINNIIYKYKQIIELSEERQKQDEIEEIRNQISKLVQAKIEQYEALKRSEYFGEEDMTNEQFMEIVQSFEEKILKLQDDIKNRQNQLQELQEKKVKEDSVKLRRNQSKWLNNIQTNKKLIEKVRNQVANLKQKKKMLQKKILAATENKSQTHQNNQEPNKAVRQSQSTKQNEMSTFQKALLIFKKKKYENGILQQRIKQLQNRIAMKKQISQKMKKEADNLEWKCLQGLQGGGNGYIDTNNDYDMSLVDKSFSPNSMSFSFDVSRFIKPKQRIGLH